MLKSYRWVGWVGGGPYMDIYSLYPWAHKTLLSSPVPIGIGIWAGLGLDNLGSNSFNLTVKRWTKQNCRKKYYGDRISFLNLSESVVQRLHVLCRSKTKM